MLCLYSRMVVNKAGTFWLWCWKAIVLQCCLICIFLKFPFFLHRGLVAIIEMVVGFSYSWETKRKITYNLSDMFMHQRFAED